MAWNSRKWLYWPLFKRRANLITASRSPVAVPAAAERQGIYRTKGTIVKDDIERIKQILVKELEKYFGADERRINHAKKVLKYAIELLKKEKADPYIVVPAAILHDVGIKVAEEKYNSSAAKYQEQEGLRLQVKYL